MLRLALVAALFSIVTALCPSGFNLVRNGECYSEVAEAQNVHAPEGPSKAKAQCAKVNALPVIIRNQEDDDYWVSVAKEDRKKGFNYGFTMLGLECNNAARWQWADGTKITYKPAGYNPALDEECDNEHDAWSWGCMWMINPEYGGMWEQICGVNHVVDLYCVFVPKVDQTDSDPVCDNFSYDEGDDICYQVAKTASNFTKAKFMCNGFGANVASVHNDRENTFLRRLAVSKGLVNAVMLGGKWDGKSTQWEDGTKTDYQNFATGFPKDGSGECLAMQTNDVGGKWMNVDCTAIHPFACARKSDVKLPACNGTHNEGEIIYSPGFPSSASEPCEFQLTVAHGMLVEVKIIMLEANSCCDKLVLTEGTLGGTEIATLTGDQYNGYTLRTSSENAMGVSWQPKGAVNVRGMTITFHSVPK